MPVEILMKGALPDLPDERDYQIESLGAAALPPVDWSQEFMTPYLGPEDQADSDACVSYAASYYHTQVHAANYSRRDLFARIALSYGAYIRDGVKAIVEAGQATRDEVPDPAVPTPQNMRDKTGITTEKQASHKELNYFIVPKDIDSVAAAIRAYAGVIFGVVGSNPGWRDLENPRPPLPSEAVWGHALYACGYHLHNGKKCIIAKSSWKEVEYHHIKENYFANPTAMENFIFNPWTLIPKGQTMDNIKIVKNGSTVGLMIEAHTIAELQALGAAFNKPVNVDASGNITNIDIVI